MKPLVDQAKVNYVIPEAKEHFKPEDSRPAINFFLYELALRHHENPPPLFFRWHDRFAGDLERAALLGWEGLEAQMQVVGQTLIDEMTAAAI